MHVDSLNRALEGSPYLLDDSLSGAERAAFLRESCEEVEVRQREVQTRFEAESAQIRQSLKRVTQSRLVYESNKLESAGLPLEETDAAIAAAPSDLTQLSRFIAEEAVKADAHLLEVLGLHEATIFARKLADDFCAAAIPVREIDLRSLHEMTLPTARFAGRYRNIEVGISGSSHRPPSVVEVPAQMAQLVSWLNDTAAPPALAAAVVHSWLTIIHPFEDGNGRVARLLANVVLLKASWPPLIVRSSDRLQYLDALVASDQGGDLLPLFDLFVKSLRRSLREFEKPDLAERLFIADLKKFPDRRYSVWWDELDDFLACLRAELQGDDIYIDRVSVPNESVFYLLEERDPSGNTWLAKVRSQDRLVDLLLWLGYMSNDMYNSYKTDWAPAIYISERDRSPNAVQPYRNVHYHGSPLGVDEIAIVPYEVATPALVRSGSTVLDRSIADAAKVLASQIRSLR